jgi:hypothetical protein
MTRSRRFVLIVALAAAPFLVAADGALAQQSCTDNYNNCIKKCATGDTTCQTSCTQKRTTCQSLGGKTGGGGGGRTKFSEFCIAHPSNSNCAKNPKYNGP